MAGFENAKGDIIGNVAADLQDPPETLIEMMALVEQGHKVVLGTRSEHKGGSWTSDCFYWLMRRFINKKFPSNGFDMSLVRREVITKICRMKEKNTPPLTLLIWTGYPYSVVYYSRGYRPHGVSQFNLEKRIKFFIDSVITFSYLPIRFMSALGMIVSLISFIVGFWIAGSAILGNITVPGWASIMTIIVFFMGTIMTMLGIIGEYVWRTLDEIRGREAYVIDEIYEYKP